jgi:hypothetical protein
MLYLIDFHRRNLGRGRISAWNAQRRRIGMDGNKDLARRERISRIGSCLQRWGAGGEVVVEEERTVDGSAPWLQTRFADLSSWHGGRGFHRGWKDAVGQARFADNPSGLPCAEEGVELLACSHGWKSRPCGARCSIVGRAPCLCGASHGWKGPLPMRGEPWMKGPLLVLVDNLDAEELEADG